MRFGGDAQEDGICRSAPYFTVIADAGEAKKRLASRFFNFFLFIPNYQDEADDAEQDAQMVPFEAEIKHIASAKGGFPAKAFAYV